MCPIRSPQAKVDLQQQQKQQKTHTPMEIVQLSTQWLLGQGRNKELKDILEFNKKDDTEYTNLWDTMKEY